MRELRFETGIEEFEVNGCGVLRFNPTDPGLYARFAAFCEELPGHFSAEGGRGPLLARAAEQSGGEPASATGGKPMGQTTEPAHEERARETGAGGVKQTQSGCAAGVGAEVNTDAKKDPAAFLQRMDEADRAVKRRLGEVFGAGNNMEEIFAGVNLLGLTAGGTTVLENLMDALAPVVRESAEAREAELKARAAKAKKKANAARRAR